MSAEEAAKGNLNPADPPKQVAIVFADVVGTTLLLEKGGDLAFIGAIEEYLGRVQPLMQTCRGQMIKTVGDGFLALFDDAADALGFAIALQRSLLHQPILIVGHHLRARMGIHMGAVHFARTSYGPEALGSDVGTTARLTAVAQPGEIVVSQIASLTLREDQRSVLGPIERAALKGMKNLAEFCRVNIAGV